MDSSLYVGLSRQMVLRRAMDVTANNVANASTPGYRTQNPMFNEYISDPKGATEPLSMVYDKGQYMTTTAGPAQFTGDVYDVALQGPGFINIQLPSGAVQYTRAGNFNIDAAGKLITSSGFQVGNAPIIIPEGTKEVKITPTGDVLADNNAVGTIGMTEFANLNELQPEGNGLYSAKTPGTPAIETSMKQGMIEGSNVNSINEMTRMIDISRQYQQMMSMMQKEHDREVGAIQRLAKTSS